MTMVAAAFLIILLGALAQAVSGFGFALVTVPLLTMVTDPRTAVVGASLASLVLTVGTAVRERAHVRWRTAGLLTGAASLGMPVGLLVLLVTPDRLLAVLIAVVVAGCALLVWRGFRLRAGPAVVGGVGLLTGVLTTATGTNGPPLVAAFHALGYDPRTFRATLAATFAGSGLIGVVGFLVTSQLGAAAGRVALAGLPALALGWWLGDRVFARVDPAGFRRVVLLGLVACAAVALAGAV